MPRQGHGRPVKHDSEDEDEEDIYDILVAKSGCKEQHFALLDCMEDHNRDWRKCQDKVKEFRACMQSQQTKNQNSKLKP
eukprot:gene8107-767_t